MASLFLLRAGCSYVILCNILSARGLERALICACNCDGLQSDGRRWVSGMGILLTYRKAVEGAGEIATGCGMNLTDALDSRSSGIVVKKGYEG